MEKSAITYADRAPMTKAAEPAARNHSARSKAPVFVLGCPRSGTTLLYHMLLSAGGFAVYRAESNVFNLLSPRFGGLRSRSSREKWLQSWLQSKLFTVSGLDAQSTRAKLLNDCRTPGDCLRLFMEEITRGQGAERWADCTPDHLLYALEIKRQVPDALIIHIIRDGRDVALSYAQQGWARPLPWDRGKQLEVAGLYWSWVVAQGRKQAQELGGDYTEVRYEDLVTDARPQLARLSTFIDQDLDYDHIQSVAIGSVSVPNSSFDRGAGKDFHPVGRWKTQLSPVQLAALEALIGDRLLELEYPMSQASSNDAAVRYMRQVYPRVFAAKLWLKDHTPLGRLTDVGPMNWK